MSILNLAVAAFVPALAAAQALQVPVVSLAEGAACGCTQLSSTFGNRTIFSNSTTYATEVIEFWDVRSDLAPACIFEPSSADDLASGVQILAGCGTQFAVRGGGHMNYPGSNNINGGVMVSLSSINQNIVDAESETIDVGPGSRWVDVYNALDEYGLYAIGGRMKTIGVPGLTLIGGFHYFINKYGFAMDNVVSYDVVLGNGTQVVANKTDNFELFWALKGGANNFGLVTNFKLQAFPMANVSITYQTYNESAIEDFIGATCELVNNDGSELAAGSIITIQYNATTKDVTSFIMGMQEGTESPPSRFEAFSKIPSTSTMNAVMTPKQWHAGLDTPNQMFRVQFAHKTMIPDAAQLYRIYQGWKDAVDSISDVEGLFPTFVMNIVPKSALSVAKNNGVGNVWGLDDDQNYIIWQFSTGWANEEDDLRMTSWSRSLLDYWHQENQLMGLSHEWLYMGDAGEFQDPYSTFPRENIERMRQVRSDYDPLEVFSRLNWGGFKLSR
ncbi:hypothetical protein E8E14_011519 [Neopestalotiopsis sp. 37M]|nr:hypothetical protein E8E14_011519 [Neopestalotiopsis sp. 37M]